MYYFNIILPYLMCKIRHFSQLFCSILHFGLELVPFQPIKFCKNFFFKILHTVLEYFRKNYHAFS